MLATVNSCALTGIEGFLVRVEVNLSAGMPVFDVVGLPDAAVKESRERVRAALKNSGYGFPDDRLTVKTQESAQLQNRVAVIDGQRAGHLLAGAQVQTCKRLAARTRHGAVVGNQPQKTEEGTRIGMRGDKRPLTLPTHQQILGRQLIDGTPHGALAHLKAGGQLHFAGNHFAGLPFTIGQRLNDEILNLTVKRPEGRHRSMRGHAAISSQFS